MKIELIDKNWLLKLEPLLAESFGEPISIDEEIEYFQETNPTDWFILLDDENNPLGFLRHFPILNEDNIQVELYAKNNIDLEKILIKKFDEKINNKVVRYCLKKKNNELINYLSEIGYTDKIQEFQYYLYSNKSELELNNSIRFASTNSKDITEIIDVLKEFQEFSEAKVINLITQKRLIVCEKNKQIIGVSLNNISDEFIEIVEISIKSEFRRNGYGKELLDGIVSIYPDKNVTLKVNKENISAINLYKKSGFEQELEKTELWLSKFYY